MKILYPCMHAFLLKKKKALVFSIIWGFVFFSILYVVVADDDEEEDEDDDDDDASNFYASVGSYLLLFGQINVVLLHLMRLERRYVRSSMSHFSQKPISLENDKNETHNEKSNHDTNSSDENSSSPIQNAQPEVMKQTHQPKLIFLPLYKKTHGILRYVHYIFSIGGLGLISIHGLSFERIHKLVSILGWGLWGVLVLYLLSGILLWYRLLPIKRSPKMKQLHRWVNQFHRSWIIFYILIFFHLLHMLSGD